MLDSRGRRWLALVVGLVLVGASLAACGSGDTDHGLDRVCDGQGCISLSRFSANINAQLGATVVGSVSLVGALPIVVQNGAARTAADPPAQAFTTDSRMMVASLSKLFTTIGVLRALKARNLTVDASILPYLPPDWTPGPNIDAVTFKDLLTHRAGFRIDGISGDDRTYAGLKQRIELGVTLPNKAVAAYNLSLIHI